ncbi:MAG: hypothetical protein IKW85_00430 [Muribaculaceae bacterium]|nr:hypothetical protein [Muribaculaceae bacterium]
MKKTIIILTLCLLGGMVVQAQTQNKKEKQEVVKLKNGHRVRGKIVTYAPLDSLVIQEDDGTLQTIYWDNIKQITKEDWQPQQTLGSDFTPGEGPQRGYRGFVDLEYYNHIDANSENHFGFSTVHGYQFYPWLFVGAGAGVKISHKKHYKDTSYPYLKDIYMFPVFADVRFDLLKSKFSPYLDCRVGYTLGNKAFGVMFNPSLGCRMGLNDKLAINASLGYSTQSTDLVVYSKHNTAIWHHEGGNWQNNPYHCISFKLGIEF